MMRNVFLRAVLAVCAVGVTGAYGQKVTETEFLSSGVRCRATWTGQATGWRVQTAGHDGAFADGGAVQKLASFMGEPPPSVARTFEVIRKDWGVVCRASDGTRLKIATNGEFKVMSASGACVTRVRGIAANADRTRIEGELLDEEPVFGLGSRLDRLNKRGQRLDLWTSDGYNNSSATYLAIPFFTTHRGGGVFVNRYEGMTADFGASERNRWSIELKNPTLDVYFFAKDRIADALGSYAALSGHADEPEDWNMGPVICRYYPDFIKAEGTVARRMRGGVWRGWGVKEIMDRHIATGIRPAAAILEGAAFDGLDAVPERLAGAKRMMQVLAERNVKPMIYMRVGQVFAQKDFRPEYATKVTVSTNGVVWQKSTTEIPDIIGRDYNPDVGKNGYRHHPAVDITNPAMWEWYVEKVWKPLVDLGVRGVKIDFCEELPDEGVTYGSVKVGYHWHDPSVFAKTGIHHAYPTFFISRFYREMSRLTKDRGGFMVLCRGGGIGSGRNPFMWAGDQQRLYEKLDDQLLAVLNSGMSGVPFMTYDMAGYQYANLILQPDGEAEGRPVVLGRSRTTDITTEADIFRRGVEFTVFTPCVQTHGFVRNVYDFDAATVGHYRRHMVLRQRLAPYIRKLNAEAAKTGVPVVRPLVFRYQDDPRTWDVGDEFLLGDAVLVAPVLGPGKDREVYLPEGVWERQDGFDFPVYLDRRSREYSELAKAFGKGRER